MGSAASEQQFQRDRQDYVARAAEKSITCAGCAEVGIQLLWHCAIIGSGQAGIAMEKQTGMADWRRRLLWSLALVWAAGLVWAWWWMDGRHGQVFERPAYFAGDQVPGPFPAGQIQVVHVSQPCCPCNAGLDAYIREMTARFGRRGVPCARDGSLPRGRVHVLGDLDHCPSPASRPDWPGRPAVAIWDVSDRLAYVGAYGD